METLKEVKRQSLKESFDSFMNHADDCNSCQFNIKTVVGLALGSQIDLQKCAIAGIAAGIGGHFTQKITGEDALTKAAIGVAISSTAVNVIKKVGKVHPDPKVEAVITVAGLIASNKFVNSKQHLNAWDFFFF